MYGNLKRGEDTEQMGVIDWSNWNTGRFPELKLLFHVPNGGKRNAAEAARFKAMGVKAGVPDLCLPVPRGGYAGLYIEMKYGKKQDNREAGRMDSQLDRTRLSCEGMLGRAGSNGNTGRILAARKNNHDRSVEQLEHDGRNRLHGVGTCSGSSTRDLPVWKKF